MSIATPAEPTIESLLTDHTAPDSWVCRYAAMAQLFDEVRRRYPCPPASGLSLLHPRHSLPANQLRLLEQLAKGYTTDVQIPSRLAVFVRWIRCVVYALQETLSLLWVKPQLWRALGRARHVSAMVVIKTWWFGPEAGSRTTDFYFGSLAQQLRARGISTVWLCGDTREIVDPAFAKAALTCSSGPAVPEALLVPIWAPLMVAARQLKTALSLRRWAARERDGSLARVCAMAAVESVQPITLRNTLHFYSAKAAVKRWRPRAFVTLYEGQPWEQPAWQGVKAADATCLIVGYQHTVLMQHSLEVLSPRRIPGQIAAPEVVLCVGEVTAAMLAERHQPLGTRLVTFGTFRRAATESAPRPGPEPARRTVLVLPEGIPSEARALFDFATQLAKIATDHHFIFRCHPVLPFERIRPALREDPLRLPNIELSPRDPISEDFARSSVVLYRGSSSVLYALLHGLKPLYVHEESLPDVDPLFALKGWREAVASPDEASHVLRRYAETGSAAAQEFWQPAADYANAYTCVASEESIARLLDAVGWPS